MRKVGSAIIFNNSAVFGVLYFPIIFALVIGLLAISGVLATDENGDVEVTRALHAEFGLDAVIRETPITETWNGQKWEYLYVGYAQSKGNELLVTSDTLLTTAIGCENICTSSKGIAHYFNVIGDEGWELVTYYFTPGEQLDTTRAMFKRPEQTIQQP